MKVLVTGGAGFIGANLVDKLLALNHEVVVIDNLYTGDKKYVSPKAKFYNMDIREKNIIKVFAEEKFDIVYHLAAQVDVNKSIINPKFDSDVNIAGTINILESCKKYNVRKFIYSSSAAVYGEPKYLGIDEDHPINIISFYGLSKYTAENYIKLYSKLYGFKYIILRYANVYGIRQNKRGEGGVIGKFIDLILNKKNPIIYGDGMQTRDFIFVDDVIEANILAMERGNNEILNIGSGVEISINDLIDMLKKILHTQIEPLYNSERKGDIKHSFFNINRAYKRIGWKPKYSLYNGLIRTVDFYRSGSFE
ncbi:UDP-glucose 4-epimerase [Caloranaerobacter sp. TR13]|uniref:NAD-dependent epimerase/dehydratase family protein n=1 Tax=Caloranaerobacter sp. TR13 TaxID=1302151 RepID=UPI0006D476B1|nr:NAD-dependent epimerase/dehydratase family protein [Caloranaerobacter sp. TR13]KPU27311.1 UDP-glucose 4-epimerase [Caloranaerobacter sp. TR13]